MGYLTDDELRELADQIGQETEEEANTASRIGTFLNNLIDSKPNARQAFSEVAEDSELDAEDSVLVDCTDGPVTITLNAAANKPAKEYSIIKSDSSSNALTIVGTGGEEISGQAEKSVDTQWSGYRVKSDGVDKWIVISNI